MLLHDAPWVLPGIGRGRRAVTATDTVTAADQGLTIDATSGTFTENLTASATLGAGFHVAIYNSGSGVITIDPAGVETIRTPDGTATTLALTQGQGVVLSCTGAAWEVIASVGLAAASSTALTVQDSVFTIIGNVDATKKLVTQVDTQGAGFTLTLDVGAQTGSRTILVPVLTGTDTLAALAVANNFSAAQTISNATASTSIITGSLINAGGFGNTGAAWIGGLLNVAGPITAAAGIAATTGAFSGATTITNATASTNTATGAVIVTGGVGIGGALNVAGQIKSSGIITGDELVWGDNSTYVGKCTYGSSSLIVGSFSNRALLLYTNSALAVTVSTAGVVTLAGTADGILNVPGKITAKAAVPGSFADLAAVQTYLASILT